jgi:hypothetical protein
MQTPEEKALKPKLLGRHGKVLLVILAVIVAAIVGYSWVEYKKCVDDCAKKDGWTDYAKAYCKMNVCRFMGSVSLPPSSF